MLECVLYGVHAISPRVVVAGRVYTRIREVVTPPRWQCLAGLLLEYKDDVYTMPALHIRQISLHIPRSLKANGHLAFKVEAGLRDLTLCLT